jgi:hypothetical protein
MKAPHLHLNRKRLAAVTLCVLGLTFACAASPQSESGSITLHGQVTDENGLPIQRAQVVVSPGTERTETIYTDAAGRFEVNGLTNPEVHLALSKPGFFLIEDRKIDLNAGINELSLMLNHESEVQEQLEVKSQPIQIDPDTTSHQESLVQHEILNTPTASSHDLQQSLRTIPQVLADSGGRLHVAGGRQGQTEVLLDGFEINNPANGAFASRVNVDAVRAVTVETGGYGAEFAHASAGVVSLDTQAGDDAWRFGTTNFIPEANVQQGTHFGNWYPRVTLSGPIEKGKVWFSEAGSIQHTFRLVKELPKGQNTETQWAEDSLLRGQINLTPRNTLQGSLLFNRLHDGDQGLNSISPLSTTLNIESTSYFGSIRDQVWVGSMLFDFGVAIDNDRGDSTPQGTSPYTITPSNATGSYFQALHQRAQRLQAIGNITSGSLRWGGTHTFSGGWNVDGSNFSQGASRSNINFLRADGTLAEVATFGGPAAFRIANTELGAYIQDLWRPWKPVVFSFGLRTDWDRLIHRDLVEPRIAMNWVPAGDGRMKFTIAWGKHYQPLNLAILAQGSDQYRSDTFYDPLGLNQLPGSPVISSFIVPVKGLAQQHSYNSTVEWEARFFKATFVGSSFLLRESRDGLAWESLPGGSLLLQNNRSDRYISGEIWARQVFGENAEFEADYTRSRASTNEALDPTLAQLILAPQQAGSLLWDSPNRLVTSGWTPIPIWGLLLSGFFEYRTGFPFSVLNEQQQLIGAPNRMRFPDYLSLNLGLEKRFHFRGHEWAIRVTGVNLPGHKNPDTVVNNIDAPNFLAFSGGQARAFTARLRLVTKH